MATEKALNKTTLKAKAKKFIRDASKGNNKGWLGVAPSYLCGELELSYDDVCALLLELEQEGFIYDNKNGNYHRLSDGRTCATRFFMTGFEHNWQKQV